MVDTLLSSIAVASLSLFGVAQAAELDSARHSAASHQAAAVAPSETDAPTPPAWTALDYRSNAG
ncbi:hypothetical protein CAL29_26690 [Bordetella genomosp. 10]|uniref:Uncharacterized protein n=1 Tax=Bordetella genomosp. 10 TaxID=1416804 RepID=A0A261S2B3_9BORD|nr:hypothetical protein CAL29_26690 [Bordetella genomosp. 10]